MVSTVSHSARMSMSIPRARNQGVCPVPKWRDAGGVVAVSAGGGRQSEKFQRDARCFQRRQPGCPGLLRRLDSKPKWEGLGDAVARTIWTFQNGSSLEFDRGQFDEWCVYEVSPNGQRVAPRDVDYFRELLAISAVHGRQRVYDDFVVVFDASGPKVTDESVGIVVEVGRRYGDDEELMKRLLLILHMGMVAENVKKNTRLGKRIKRLGVHDLLLESGDVARAAHFMRGMGWREIDELCKARGF